MNESEIESHFKDHLQDEEEGFHTDKDDDEDDDDDDEQLLSRLRDHSSDSDSDGPSLMSPDKPDGGCIGKSSSSSAVVMRKPSSARSPENEEIVETPYSENHETTDDFGSAGDQTEEVAEENKSLLWTLLKQVRPGMDLSKVVLPTFILEPRSFLEKLSDYYFHCDILAKAGLEDDPFIRMKLVTQWYEVLFFRETVFRKVLIDIYFLVTGICLAFTKNQRDSRNRTTQFLGKPLDATGIIQRLNPGHSISQNRFHIILPSLHFT